MQRFGQDIETRCKVGFFVVFLPPGSLNKGAHMSVAKQRVCGSCTACCKPPDLNTPEYYKPQGVWCKHCAIGEGCTIYDTRPRDCQNFECEWLKGYGSEKERPDRFHIILDHAIRRPDSSASADIYPREIFQIWEVTEGALAGKAARVMQITKEKAAEGLFVAHIPLRGDAKIFQRVGNDLMDVSET